MTKDKKAADRADKQARLSRALRDNLRKRKQQSRDRDDAASVEGTE